MGLSKNDPLYFEKRARYVLNYRGRMRKAIIALLGGACVACEYDDPRALQIDHINGDGHIEKKKSHGGVDFHRRVLDSVLKNERRYQILCANCNWIKRFENNETGMRKQR